MTIKDILNRIEYTVIIDGVEHTDQDITFSAWMEDMIKRSESASGYTPEKMFDPVARDNFQKYIALAYYAGFIPAKVVETRTNEIGADGCYVFTFETFGTLEPETDSADEEDATPTREEVEAVLQESEEAETRAQALITELRGTTEAAKALIEDAASITGKSAADFAGALSEYAAIVRGVAEEYQGKATVAMIRADHPELDFFDDEDIETIIRCGNSYTTTEAAEAGEENNMDYNYLEAVMDDVREYIRENIDLSEWKGDRDGLEEKLNDDLWIEDCVTGNASGSYTFSTYRAEQYLAHNWELLAEALREFGADDVNPIDKGAEWCDLMIRCYLLGQAICEVLDELEDELEEDDSEEEV